MTRGSNRRDVPSESSSGFINFDCPVESWGYWERRFAQTFKPKLRIAIALTMTDLRKYRDSYDEPEKSSTGQRLDSKAVKRALKKTIKTGIFPSSEIAQFVVLHSTDLPNASVSEKAHHVLLGFTQASQDYLMERSQPSPVFTRVFYELFHSHSLNVSLGSAGTLYGKEGMGPKEREKAAPETPFVEFVRRCVWEQRNSSASFCAKVRKTIQRCQICTKL
jgi:hypothetical protein